MEALSNDNSLDMERLRRLVWIDNRRKEIDAEAKKLNEERQGIEQILLTHFEQNGIDRMTCDGRTVYIRVQLWARAAGGNTAALCDLLLKDEQTAPLVSETVNVSKLSSHFREMVERLMTQHGLPRDAVIEEIKRQYDGMLELADQISLQSRGK